MKIGALRETLAGETRVAMTPDSIGHLMKLGHDCLVESGAGIGSGFEDADYVAAGAQVVADGAKLISAADVVVKLREPTDGEIKKLSAGKTWISFFWPAQNDALLEKARASGANVIAMDMVPRISRAQKMDALSSMANIGGYRAVIEAAASFPRLMTGQVTAAGKVPPAKVLVVGAGVAGLAAIGAATSLGAITYAFDVRPEVAEQIESMGAEFVFLDFDEQQDGAATGGYAAPSSPEFREKQLEKFQALAPDMDIVITTALIPGRDAPLLWTKEMVADMKRGSVIVDMAAEKGGNCELTQPGDKVITENGVTIIGYTDLPARMASQASTLYANNIRHMISDLTPEKDGAIVHDMEDDVIRGATVAHEGEITFPPPPPKIQAIAAKAPAEKPKTEAEIKAEETARHAAETKREYMLLGGAGALMLLIGAVAPESFMQHFIVFALACFVGFQVIWGVSHALHTPLMAITNAISGIVIIGALLQVAAGGFFVPLLAFVAILIATVNIVGGFAVTRRMLAMFQKS